MCQYAYIYIYICTPVVYDNSHNNKTDHDNDTNHIINNNNNNIKEPLENVTYYVYVHIHNRFL